MLVGGFAILHFRRYAEAATLETNNATKGQLAPTIRDAAASAKLVEKLAQLCSATGTRNVF